MPGPPPAAIARHPAERFAAYRARPKATAAATPTKPPAVVRYRRPDDRRSRPQQWADAVQTLASLLDSFRSGGTTCPQASTIARRLGSPRSRRRAPGGQTAKGFGRDCRRSSLTRRRSGRAKSACHFRGRPHKAARDPTLNSPPITHAALAASSAARARLIFARISTPFARHT